MSFPLIGNDKLRAALEEAIANTRLPHAMILEGEAGLGKHTLARYIAMAAVCSAQEKPCGTCHACHLVDLGNHPDVVTVAPEEKKKNITVAQVRGLRQKAYVKPHMADYRVFIIENAETMNEQAQNALLKILEEPPVGVLFVLITPSASALLETVLSRCVVYTLASPKQELALPFLAAHTKVQDTAQLADALQAARGNIGRAMDILSSKNHSIAESSAKEFVSLLFSGNELEMLKLTFSFEKDRVSAAAFFAALKYELSRSVRANYKNADRIGVLNGLYEQIPLYEDALKTNVNLSLLFCTAVCTAKKLYSEYL